MPKRGETLPWRVTYTWPTSGYKGVVPHRTEQEANDYATWQRTLVGPDGDSPTVEVSRRPDNRKA